MSNDGQGVTPDWRQRLKQIGKRAFIREEMMRLRFWPPNPEVAEKQAELLSRLRVRYDELAEIRRELDGLDLEIAQAKDIPGLLKEIRKRRIERIRAARAARREERAREQEERRAQDRERCRRTPPFLGRGVSAGLSYEGGDMAKLASLGLPALSTAADLAAAIGISETELAWLVYHRGAARTDHYYRFTIPKRNGGERVISSPKRRLRVAQRWLLEAVLSRLEPHQAATAFHPGASIRDNAARHAGRGLVVRIDLEDFFPSISFRRVKGLFQSFGYNEGIATIFALLATEPPRVAAAFGGERLFISVGQRQLPQGACTSPAFTNLLCRKLDRRLSGAAASLGFTYSRYADDLVFSHLRRDASAGTLFSLVRRIIGEESFRINEEKTFVMRPQHRQAVTGLVVNQEPHVSRRDRRRFRALLHHCETEGFDAVSGRLGRDARAHACGYHSFLKMVTPAHAAAFRRRYPWLGSDSGEAEG
jgi:retron-type reverse transcriptase